MKQNNFLKRIKRPFVRAKEVSREKGIYHVFRTGISYCAWNLLHYIFRKDTMLRRIKGHKMIIDLRDHVVSRSLFLHGVWENFTTEIIERTVREGDIVLDIGAHIGYYTLIFARIVGEKGKVVAFEPEPRNFILLRKNIEANGYKNIIGIRKAVSNKTGKSKLWLSAYNYAAHSLYYEPGIVGRDTIMVDTIALDDFVMAEKVDFIKMDIQGAEGWALRGMTNLLRKNMSVKLVTEFWPLGLRRSGIEPSEFICTLEKFDFRIYEIDEEKEELKPVNNADILLRKYTIKNGKSTNLLCLRHSSNADLIST